MKKLTIITGLFCLLAAIPACKEKDNGGPLIMEAPVIATLETTSFDLPEESENPYYFRMTWSKARFFEGDSPVTIDNVQYAVEADLADNNFSDPMTVETTRTLYLDIYAQTLRDICDELTAADNEDPVVVSFRIKAAGSGLMEYSEAVLLTVTPYVDRGGDDGDDEIYEVEESTLGNLDETYILTYQGVNNPLAFTVSWNETKFYNEAEEELAISPINYTLQICPNGTDFAAENTKTLAMTTSMSAEIYTNTLNTVLMEDFGATANNSYAVQIRLSIAYGQGERTGAVFSSNVLTVNVVPFAAFDMLQAMYVYGQISNWYNGWNGLVHESNAVIPMFKSDNETSNHVFSFTGYLPEGGFKILPEQNRGTDFAFCMEGSDMSSSGSVVFNRDGQGNSFWNTSAGFKTFTIDVHNMTYTFDDYDPGTATTWDSMDFAGTMNSWGDSPLVMTKTIADNNHIWILEADIAVSGETTYHCGKFRGNGSWDTPWQNVLGNEWRTPYGSMIFKGEQDVNIFFGPEACTIRVFFNDLTAQYAIFRIL